MTNPARALFAAALLTAGGALAQSATTSNPSPNEPAPASLPALSYDVASIRRSAQERSVWFTSHPHEASLTAAGMSIRNLITNAYGVYDYQISGGPQDLLMQRYDLRATSDPADSAILAKLTDCYADQVKQRMLQGVLEDRFKLTLHRSTKEFSGYSLIVAKGGLKMRESQPDPAVNPAAPRGGSMTMRSSKSGTAATFHSYSIATFADWLAANLRVPVANKTALTAPYDITLHYTHDLVSDTRTSAADSDPDIFTALPEQLGLKLEPTKVTLETLVIDHIEPPTEN